MNGESQFGPDNVGSQSRQSIGPLPSGDSFTAEITRRRLRGRIFGDADGSLEVGPFELREQIGAGAMGTVYAAWDRRLARKVALKFLLYRESRDDEIGAREAQALARLAHPNVVSVFDVGTYEGRVWLAMEFVVGSTMRTWIEARSRAPAEILARWAEVGRGLAAVHALDLVHRDIKPDNVLVDEQSRARLIDFGLVCARRSPVSTVPSKDPERSSPTFGVGIAGTRAYAAPEQGRGESLDGRADQYAYCVSVWESLVGSRPARDEAGALLPGVGSELPRRIRRALARGLSVEPEHRFADMDALLDALARPSIRRWLALGFILTAGVGTVTGAVLRPEAAKPTPCVGADATIDELWTSARRDALHDRSPELAAGFGAWADDWRQHAQRNCEERRSKLLSADLADRRRACLDRRLLEFEGAMDWERATDGPTGGWPVALVDPALCGAASLSSTSVPPPARAEEIAAIRRELAKAERDGPGPSVAEIAHGDALLAEAQAIGWPRLVGEVAVATARVHRFVGDTRKTSTRLGQAIDIAQKSGDDELAFAAWSGMVQLQTDVELDPEEARWAWERQRAAAEAMGGLALHRGDLALAAGNIERLSGSPRAAEAEFRQALVHYELAGVSGGYRRVQVLDVLAASLAVEGRSRDSQRAIEQSEELRVLLGHPTDGDSRREGDHAFSSGLASLAAGDLDAARTAFGQALDSYENGLGGGQRVAQVLVALATVEDAAGHRGQARHYAERADAVCVAELSAIHPLRASTQSALGTIALRDGRAQDSVDAFARALEIESEYQPEGGIDRALAHSNLAEALAAAGRIAQARAHAEQALAELGSALPEDHGDLAYAHKAMGVVLLAEGRASEAAEYLERAISLHPEATDSSAEVDELHTLLTRARDLGDHLREEPR